MKKIGHFFFTFVPLILVTIIQYLAVFFGMGVSTLIESASCAFSKSRDFYHTFENLNSLWASSDFNAYIMIVYTALSIVVFGLWYYMRYEGNYLPNFKHTFHPLTFLGLLMLTPGMQYLSSYIISFTASLFPKWLETYEELFESAGFDDSLTLGVFLYTVIFAPLAEELIFRGVTLHQAKRALPFWAANLMQAILFGIFHMNMIQGIYAFCLGLILGYICERGGSIYHTILLHILYNFWGAVISQFVTIGDSIFSFLFWFFFAVTLTVCGILIFILGTKKCRLTASADAIAADNGNSNNSHLTNA